MGKLILRRVKVVEQKEEHIFAVRCLFNDNELEMSVSKHWKKEVKINLGERYLMLVSPFDLKRGRFILSEKGYDLDYSYIDKQD